MSDPYVIASWTCCVTAVVGFAIYSVVFATLEHRRAGPAAKLQTTEDFVTARKTANLSQIAWSFYATSVGAWVIVTPANYPLFAGWIGMVMYSVAVGIPTIAIAFLGIRLQKLFPNCSSLADFCGERFGWASQLLVVVLTLVNMSIVIIAEYTTIGALFADFVGTTAWPFIALVAILTLSYTAYGGLHISIITDRVQAIFGMLMILILCIYTAITFRFPLGPLPEALGPNFAGYSSILTMPLSLMGASVFSEALWQRVWASEDERTLRAGAFISCGIIIAVVFIAGFFGFLAAWAGLIDETTNGNLYMFQIFKSDPSETGNVIVNSWVGVIIMILAVTMNESAIDSFQNGIAASISTRFLINLHIMWIRLAVVIFNIPFIVIALLGLDVLSLFLITNMLTTTCMIPVIFGAYSGPGSDYMSDGMAPFSFILSAIGTSIYGTSNVWDPSDVGKSIADGIVLAWYGNYYAWDYFAVALGGSIAAMCVWLLIRIFFDKVLGIWKPKPVDWEKLAKARHNTEGTSDACETPQFITASTETPGFSSTPDMSPDGIKSKI